MSFQMTSEKVAVAENLFKEAVKEINKKREVTEEVRKHNEAALKRASVKPQDNALQIAATAAEIKAKYKIEVSFEKGRTPNGPNILGVQVWESGKRFHGGGDELTFFCKDVESDLGCFAVIPSDFVKGGVAYCPSCKKGVNADRLTNMLIGKVTSQALAEQLAKMFRELSSSADIYLKYHKTDPHYVAMERAKGPDTAKRLKGMHIYPLKNILKDTAAGADLVKRFKAFVTS